MVLTQPINFDGMSNIPTVNHKSSMKITPRVEPLIHSMPIDKDIGGKDVTVGSLFNNSNSTKDDSHIRKYELPKLNYYKSNQDILHSNTHNNTVYKDTIGTPAFITKNKNIPTDLHNNINFIKNILPITPESNNSSPNDIQLNKNSNSTHGKSTLHQSISNSPSEGPTIRHDDETGEYTCHYCDAKFKMRGYLTRHIKKHALQKAYHCPYYNPIIAKEARCHTTGGFSRRDTYKTHLKARHFTYPAGVKPSERNQSDGHCSLCKEFFPNTNIWIKEHIEMGHCKALSKEFLDHLNSQAASKNKITNKLKMIKTSTGHSRYISAIESVVEPSVLLNKEALEAMVIVAKNTNRNDVLSKLGDDKLIMNSDDFTGYKRPKRKYKPRKPKAKPDTARSSPVKNASALTVLTASNNHSIGNHYSNSYSNVNNGQNQRHGGISEVSTSLYPSTSTTISPYFKMDEGLKRDAIALDSEQQPSYTELENNSYIKNDTIAINETLRREFIVDKINSAQLQETQQYLSFYNDLFGSKL